MSERQSLWGLGSKAKQIVENVINFIREPAADTTVAIQQTVQATGVGLSTVYKIRSEAVYRRFFHILFLDLLYFSSVSTSRKLYRN